MNVDFEQSYSENITENEKILHSIMKNVNYQDGHGWTILHRCCKFGHFELLKRLLKEPRLDIEASDHVGNTPLMSAIKSNRLDCALHLIDHGASVNAVNIYGNSALHFAFHNRNIEACEILLKFGAQINQSNLHGITPKSRNYEAFMTSLVSFIQENNKVMMKATIKSEAELRAMAHKNHALKNGNSWIIKPNFLLYKQLDSKIPNKSYNTFVGRLWDSEICVKCPVHQSLDATEKEILETEIERIWKCSHKNLVPLLGVCLTSPKIGIIYSYCKYPSLLEVIEDQEIIYDVKQGFLWAIQLCSALEYLHAEGMVHGNLKPSNIFIYSDHRIRLSEYGFKKSIFSPFLRNVTFCKDPRFTAPEVLHGNFTIDPKMSDVYSLGLILFSIFTRSLPFEEDSNATVVGLKIALQTAILDIPDFIPADLRDLLILCTQSDPSVRPEIPQVLTQLENISKQIA